MTELQKLISAAHWHWTLPGEDNSGPRCRDCADATVHGTCDSDGLPCDPRHRGAVIGRTLADWCEQLERAVQWAADEMRSRQWTQTADRMLSKAGLK